VKPSKLKSRVHRIKALEQDVLQLKAAVSFLMDALIKAGIIELKKAEPPPAAEEKETDK